MMLKLLIYPVRGSELKEDSKCQCYKVINALYVHQNAH